MHEVEIYTGPTTSASRFLENLDLILVAMGFIKSGMSVFVMALGPRLVLLVQSATPSWSWPCSVGALLSVCSLYPSHPLIVLSGKREFV